MSLFDTHVIVDWSGGNDAGPKPRKDAIWLCVVRDGVVEAPVYVRNRLIAETVLGDLLSSELAARRRVCVGFDFPFGYPAGFAEAVTGSADPLALWEWLERRIDDAPETNNRCAVAAELNARFDGIGPFWGNPFPNQDFDHLPRKGLSRSCTDFAERRQVENAAKGSFSCWQLAGAGSVGSQVLMGLPVLERLRRRFAPDVAVWPFEALDTDIAFVEVWPSLIADEIKAQSGDDEIRDAAQVRVLAGALSALDSAGDLKSLLDAGQVANGEGWILGVGHEDALRLAAASLPALEQGGLANDCFALPPGVDWTPVDTALDSLQKAMRRVVGAETCRVTDAGGRILAQDVAAPRAHPPSANSAIDGYGFAYDGFAPMMPLATGRAAAGAPYQGKVPNGHAVRILTGATLPDGVDTVVMQEDSQLTDDGLIRFKPLVKRGQNARAAGEDLGAGDLALPAGRRLGAPDLALLSAVGVAEVRVCQRLRVGVMSTGDELADPGTDVSGDRIFDANRPMVLGLAERWGFEGVDLGCVPDDREALRARLDHAVSCCDVVLTSGGASAGDEDHVSALLGEEGTLRHWRIAIKPGRPLALAIWQGMPVFGLPGNPVAAFVCSVIFAYPALLQMAGAGWAAPQGFLVPAAFSKHKKPGRREYLRARLTPEGQAELFASEGSGRISGLSWAEGLVELEDGGREITTGDMVRYIPFGSFGL